MTVEFKKCPACEGYDICQSEILLNIPSIIFPVDENIAGDLDSRNLSAYSCNECGHLFLNDVNPEFNNKIYTEYYKYYPFDSIECFIKYYREPFERIFSLFSNSMPGHNLLEVGVSSQEQLKFFIDMGFDCSGITPQKISGKNIISSFYEEYQFQSKFDVIVSRFNLEHIIDLDLFLSKVVNDLKETGCFVAQVPNVMFYMNQNILNVFAHEHIHYFTPNSIKILFERFGFNVEVLFHANSPCIIILGTIGSKKTFLNEYNIKKTSMINNFNKLAHKRLVFYGAGLSLTGILYCDKFLKQDLDFLIIDDNPLLKDKCMPFYKNPIVPYNKELISEDDVIILTLNSIYHKAVIDKLRQDKLTNDVYLINEKGLTNVELNKCK